MPPKLATADWLGSAPIVKDGFAFGNGVFFADVSNNRHPRASPAELKEHFKSGSASDHPAHWFEAQLIHYDLKPSKTKPVARMRLLDAINSGSLAIPARLTKLEGDLKKEWTKLDREAKMAAKAPSTASKGKGKAGEKPKATPVAKKKATTSSEAKAEEKAKVVTATKPKSTAAEKGKTTAVSKAKAEVKPKAVSAAKRKSTAAAKDKAPTSSKAKAEAKPKPAAAAKPKSTAAAKGKNAAASKESATTAKGKRKAAEPPAASGSSESAPKKPRATPKAASTSATASKGISPGHARRGAIHQGPGRSSAAASSSAPAPIPRDLSRMARRSKPYIPRGRIPSPSRGFYGEIGYGYENDDDDVEYTHLIGRPARFGWSSDDGSMKEEPDDDDKGGFGSDVKLEALGLLNGAYDLQSPSVDDDWPHLSSGLSLVLTLAGTELWGQFDLGVVEGILHFKERPGTSSFEPVPFTWRGRENEGPIMYGNHNHGWVKFLGEGRIEGELDFMSIRFSGQRRAGQGTRSKVEAQQIRNEWDGYSAEQYAEENRARWR